LQVLRHCLPSSVRRTLAELPESLDETYERVLKEIKKPNRDHAHRIMQCLVVAVRPLRAEELAEVVAVDFDDSSGVAKLKPSWRWEDEEQALLSSCSSLITLVGSGKSRVVQFSHYLFDSDKPYFAAWCKLHDIDRYPDNYSTFFIFRPLQQLSAVPLYYAALCGFHALTEHLIGKDPQQVNAYGGFHVTPLVAALIGEHFGVAELLLRHGAGATVSVRGYGQLTPLHSAVHYRDVEMVRFLLKCNADVHSQDSLGWTPLHSLGESISLPGDPNILRRSVDVARLLLEHGADVNARANDGSMPLHIAARWGVVKFARVVSLLQCKESTADVNATNRLSPWVSEASVFRSLQAPFPTSRPA